MTDDKNAPIELICPCCGATLTVDPALPVVLSHRLPSKASTVVHLKEASTVLKEEAARRNEKYQQILEAERTKGKVLDRKFQELLKKAQEEPLEKPTKDIDLD